MFVLVSLFFRSFKTHCKDSEQLQQPQIKSANHPFCSTNSPNQAHCFCELICCHRELKIQSEHLRSNFLENFTVNLRFRKTAPRVNFVTICFASTKHGVAFKFSRKLDKTFTLGKENKLSLRSLTLIFAYNSWSPSWISCHGICTFLCNTEYLLHIFGK